MRTQYDGEFTLGNTVQLVDFEVMTAGAHKLAHAVLRVLHKSRRRPDSAGWYAVTPRNDDVKRRLPPKTLSAAAQEVQMGRECAPRLPTCRHCAHAARTRAGLACGVP